MQDLGQTLRSAKAAAAVGSKMPPPLPQAAQKPPPVPGSRYLNEGELARFENLLVFAATTVEGFLAGKHRSPHFGFSAEFVEHRPYLPGDEPCHIDWQVYARTRKLYTRKFLEETDMTVHLLVDCSGSMAYDGPRREMKLVRTKRVAAALAYLMLKQGDKASLGMFSDSLVHQVPAGSTRRHLFRLLSTLDSSVVPTRRTDIARSLEQMSSRLKKRGRLVVLSDFLGMDLAAMFDALGMYIHRGFEVMLIQVLEPDEMTLPDVTLARLRDAETGEEVNVEPELIRTAYERQVREHIEDIRLQASRRRISFSTHQTDAPYLAAIEDYLGFRRR